MNKIAIFAAVLACVLLVAEARVSISPRCPRGAKAGRNIYLGAVGYIDVRGSGPISWSVCDDKGNCNRGSDYARGSRTRRSLNMFFMAHYGRRRSHTLNARLTAGGSTAVGRCTFTVA